MYNRKKYEELGISMRNSWNVLECSEISLETPSVDHSPS